MEKQESISILRSRIKEIFIKEFDDSISELKDRIIESSSIFDDIITLERRYYRINDYFKKGLIDFKTADSEITKIENTFIYIINKLSEKDINTVPNKT